MQNISLVPRITLHPLTFQKAWKRDASKLIVKFTTWPWSVLSLLNNELYWCFLMNILASSSWIEFSQGPWDFSLGAGPSCVYPLFTWHPCTWWNLPGLILNWRTGSIQNMRWWRPGSKAIYILTAGQPHSQAPPQLMPGCDKSCGEVWEWGCMLSQH